MTTLQFHERAADSWLLWNETVLSNSKHNYIGQNVNPRPQLPVVTTNPKAIAVEEANLVASPKCFLKYSKVCGWTFGTEPGGSSELEKFLPVLELFFLISWPTCLWGCYCTKKENFRWMLENSTYKRGNILIGAAKEQAEWCREVIFGSLRPRAPLQKYCFPAHHLFSRPFCQKKKVSNALPSNTECIQPEGTQWNQAYQEDPMYEKRNQGNIKMARLELSEQMQAVWMLMLPVNKKEQFRTDVQLSSEISTGPQWDQMGPWQRIDTQIIVLALQRAVCLRLRLGRSSRDLSPVERGNWYKMNTATEQSLRCNPARLCGCR